MKRKLLAIPGHLGKDVGATATLDSDVTDGSQPFLTKLQEERWINLQQVIGFCLAHSLSDLKNEVEVSLVIPDNTMYGMYDKGLIKILDTKKSYFGLEDRVKLANDLDADVIEFHNNAAPFTASGFESLCFSKNNKEGVKTEGFSLCEFITNSVKERMNCKVRDIKPIYDFSLQKYIDREIFIIKNCHNTCIITEAGFMTDKKDLNNIDVDLDGFNEQMGASIFLGYRDMIKSGLFPFK